MRGVSEGRTAGGGFRFAGSRTGQQAAFVKNFNISIRFINEAGKGFSVAIVAKSYHLKYKTLAIPDTENRQTRGGKLKNRPKKSNLTIYLIYLHNVGCGSARTANKFAALPSPVLYLRNRC